MHVHTHTHTHIHTRACTHACTHTLTSTYTLILTHTHVQMHAHIPSTPTPPTHQPPTHTYVHMHTHTHWQDHVHNPWFNDTDVLCNCIFHSKEVYHQNIHISVLMNCVGLILGLLVQWLPKYYWCGDGLIILQAAAAGHLGLWVCRQNQGIVMCVPGFYHAFPFHTHTHTHTDTLKKLFLMYEFSLCEPVELMGR